MFLLKRHPKPLLVHPVPCVILWLLQACPALGWSDLWLIQSVAHLWAHQALRLQKPQGVGRLLFPPRAACAILVHWPGIEPVPPAVEAWSPNHLIAREFPVGSLTLAGRHWIWSAVLSPISAAFKSLCFYVVQTSPKACWPSSYALVSRLESNCPSDIRTLSRCLSNAGLLYILGSVPSTVGQVMKI